MEGRKVLVVDDESRMRKLIKDFLIINKYDVLEAADGEEALEVFFANNDIDLIILDVMMPRLDGWQTAKEIRLHSKVPIIMLTAKDTEKDQLTGFEIGIDDYMSKPFSPRVLVARADAIIRRTKPDEDGALEYAGIKIDKSARTVTIDNKPVDLSFKEFELLCYFIEHKGIALSRENILNNVWNYDYYGDARTIDTHVKKLRSKMGDRGELIKTVWGLGYKFEA